MGYIRHEQLPKLREYKYSSDDKSILSRYVLGPYWWKQVIKLFPLSMAPNAITLYGFGFIVINILTLLYYSPTLDQNCPPWVYASWGIGLFLYQTFDAIDGSQARRTHQSGPLGELFDHCVDAVNTTFGVLLLSAAVNYGQCWKTLAGLFGSLGTFYIQTWDDYHTKTLSFGYVSGPVEGVFMIVIVHLLTAYHGSGDYWRQPALPALGFAKHASIPHVLYDLPFSEWFASLAYCILVYNTVSSAQAVFKARRARNQDPYTALYGLLPFAMTWTLVPIYLVLNPDILRNHLVPFMLYIGLVNAYSVSQIITAHLTKMSFPYSNVLILPLIFGVFDSLGPWLQTHMGLGWPSSLDKGYNVAFVFLCLGVSVGVYGSFIVDVIVTICDYLDIWCLSIKHPYVEEQEGNAKTQQVLGRSGKKSN